MGKKFLFRLRYLNIIYKGYEYLFGVCKYLFGLCIEYLFGVFKYLFGVLIAYLLSHLTPAASAGPQSSLVECLHSFRAASVPGQGQSPSRNEYLFLSRAGHATILSRQRDHVFRLQSCLLLQFYYICSGYSIQTPIPKKKFWALTRYYVFALLLSRS